MLEKTIQTGISQAILKKFNIKLWIPVVEKLLGIFGETEENLGNILTRYSITSSLEMKNIIIYLTNTFLQQYPPELWKNILRVETIQIDTPYTTKTRYVIVILPKEDILRRCSSVWVYMHYKEVKEFMGSDNLLYDKLKSLENIYVEEND